MRKRRIFTPGPTPLLPEAQLAMARPIIHHRTPEFKRLFQATRQNLQAIFKTAGDVVILASSGTGAMEAAVTNLLGPGDHALAVVAGKFGERWVEICQAHGIGCTPLCKDYGDAASPGEIVEGLRQATAARALLIQGCETSTGTSHDLRAIAEAVRREHPDVLIVVDAITTAACEPLETDAWGLDVVISGSQKSFAISPGLAFLSLSARALQQMETGGSGRYYFDLAREAAKQREGQTAFTPSVTLVEALHAATAAILEQGLDHVVAEAEVMARSARAGLQALGFKLLSRRPANAVTAAFPPSGIDAATLSRALEERFGVKVAGGQASLKGKIVRLAHLGYFDLLDVITALSAIELTLQESGVQTTLGRGVQAALDVAAEARSSGPASTPAESF